MSEFEGYQEDATPSPAYESMADGYAKAQALPTATATAVPANDLGAQAADLAKNMGNAVSGLIDKIGKIGMLFVIMAASITYTIASGVECFSSFNVCEGLFAYAFSVGIISLLVSVTYIVLLRYTTVLGENVLVNHIMGWFFVVWWIGGTGAGTFRGPFPATSNGYFSAWAALIASIVFLGMVSPVVKNQLETIKATVANQSIGDLVALGFASIVELIASSSVCVPCDGYTAFAVSLSCVSIVVVAVCIFLVRSNNASPLYSNAFSWLIAFQFIWWAVGFCVVTFGGPFNTVTGNGYFAALVGFLLATRLVRATALWTMALQKLNVGGGGGAQTNAPPDNQDNQDPQYVSHDQYNAQNTEGMDF